MPTGKKITKVEYMCRWCGARSTQLVSFGRPQPGSCPRRPKNRMGKSQPHTWVVNRRY